MDTDGLVLKVIVHAANINDSKGGRFVMDAARTQFPKLRMVWVDHGYRGPYWKWLQLDRQVVVEVIPQRSRTHRRDQEHRTAGDPLRLWRFPPAPRRWVVERTFAWLGRYRRFSKDDAYLPTTSEARIYAAMSHRMVRRIARGGQATWERRGQLRQLALPFAFQEFVPCPIPAKGPFQTLSPH